LSSSCWPGVLADRVNRRRLLLVTTTLTSSTLILAFILIVLGLARVPHLLVLAALSSTFRAFDEPSRMSLVPQLIDRERLPNAIALGSIPWQAGRMIGPSITGVLIAAFGEQSASDWPRSRRAPRWRSTAVSTSVRK